jgi:DNA-binding response OmpR family regulator
MVTTAVAMRILEIEDRQKVSALIKRGPTSKRYAVDVAADGIGGLELVEAYPYDLMFRVRNGHTILNGKEIWRTVRLAPG